MNWDMIGHEWAVDLLHEHVAQSQVRHAYLFTGPQGIGRRTLALRFAQALNCPQPTAPGQPCQACSTCKRFLGMAHPDLSVIQAEQVGGILKVEQIRELQHSLSLSPYESRFRVALLLRFEEAHPSAANALLKTLEEPSSQVILILTAESSESLLPTIVSRCEVLRLRPLAVERVQSGLIGSLKMSPEKARLLAHLSGGRPGFAINLYKHPEEIEQRTKWIEDLVRLISASRVERFAYADALSKNKEDLRLVLGTWLSYWRDVTLLTAQTGIPVTNEDWARQLDELVEHLDLQAAHRTLKRVEQSLQLLDRNVNARLILEVLMLDIPRLVVKPLK